jgi:hypothetical protein
MQIKESKYTIFGTHHLLYMEWGKTDWSWENKVNDTLVEDDEGKYLQN